MLTWDPYRQRVADNGLGLRYPDVTGDVEVQAHKIPGNPRFERIHFGCKTNELAVDCNFALASLLQANCQRVHRG